MALATSLSGDAHAAGVGLRRRSAPTRGPVGEDWCSGQSRGGEASPEYSATVPQLPARGFAGGFDSIWSANAPAGAPAEGTWSPSIAAEWGRQRVVLGLAPPANAVSQGEGRHDSW